MNPKISDLQVMLDRNDCHDLIELALQLAIEASGFYAPQRETLTTKDLEEYAEIHESLKAFAAQFSTARSGHCNVRRSVAKNVAIPTPETPGIAFRINVEVEPEDDRLDVADSIVDAIMANPDRGDLSARYVENGIFHIWSKSRDLNDLFKVKIALGRNPMVEWVCAYTATLPPL